MEKNSESHSLHGVMAHNLAHAVLSAIMGCHKRGKHLRATFLFLGSKANTFLIRLPGRALQASSGRLNYPQLSSSKQLYLVQKNKTCGKSELNKLIYLLGKHRQNEILYSEIPREPNTITLKALINTGAKLSDNESFRTIRKTKS